MELKILRPRKSLHAERAFSCLCRGDGQKMELAFWGRSKASSGEVRARRISQLVPSLCCLTISLSTTRFAVLVVILGQRDFNTAGAKGLGVDEKIPAGLFSRGQFARLHIGQRRSLPGSFA